MPRTLLDFHGPLADMLVEARGKYDDRPGPGQPGYLSDESADAVTAWRHLAITAHGYANGASVNGAKRPTWERFWQEGMDRAAFVKLLARQSRITRALAADGDMDTMLLDDSVRYWEYSHALSIMTDMDHAEAARRSGNKEAARRILLEMSLSIAVSAAYTGLDAAHVRETAQKCGTTRPKHPGSAPDGSRVWEPHPLFDLLSANRPV